MPSLGEFDCNITATYRLQFHKDFGFREGAALAGYLRDLGVSHVYSSPIMAARAGSIHGYDVIDFARINPELGGEEGLAALVAALHEAGLGLIVDIVPNHMCVGGADNPYWLDLLEKGRDSVYADFFDIDFDAPAAPGKVMAPFLGASYSQTLASGDLRIKQRPDGGGWAVYYHEHCFPLRDVDRQEIDARGVAAFAAPERLHALLERQHYRLASWRTANDLVNYRRFFDITSLAAIRIERPAAFERVHRVPLQLYARGWIDGLRIDHIDGLTDPRGYCEQLSSALASRRGERPEGRRGPPYIVVEKILAGGERLPNWAVAGATGYDFMNEVSALQHSPAGARKLGAYWNAVSGRSADFDEEECVARRELLEIGFCGQLEATVEAFLECGSDLGADRDLTRASLRRALVAAISRLRVYRSYALGGSDNPGAGAHLEAAFEAASREASPDTDALRLLQAVMNDTSTRPEIARAIRRFNQLTAPVAAKAVEDTAFYRYGRLLSRNDVGFDAAHLSLDIADFHRRMSDRARYLPHSMLATATHDHKRGEDVRARLAVLSEVPDAWIDHCRHWSAINARFRNAGFDGADEYLLYQTIVGAWPLDLGIEPGAELARLADRLVEWQRKALREGKLRSSWMAPNTAYEEVAEAFTRAVLDPVQSRAFLQSIAAFVGAIASAGMANSLTQVALRCLLPGVPDLYRGTELWDFSLVDPDNRRPVDFGRREELLAEGTETAALSSGAAKQGLIKALLTLRRRTPELFAFGDYREIEVEKIDGLEVLAFSRRHETTTLVCAVLLRAGGRLFGSDRLTPPVDAWGDAELRVEGSGYRRIWGEAELASGQSLARIFAGSPVAVWIGG